MFPLYTADGLSSKSLSELKVLARQIGVSAFPGKLSRKDTFVNAIISHQQAAVELVQSICDELVAEHEAQIKVEAQRDFAAEEAAILAEIESVGDALNSFILSDNFAGSDCPEVRRLEEKLDALSQRYQEVCNERSEAIGSNFEPIIDIWWQGESNGAVSIDGGNSYRAFRVLDMHSDCPIVKLICSKKNELDSRWIATKNNRYMRAVLEAVPAHIQQLANEIWEDGEIVGYQDSNDEGPINRGEGRGRIEPAGEWVEF